RVYGPAHYDVAVNLNNLAALRQVSGDAREAEQLYQRALALKEKLLGASHPDVAVTANNLAVLHKTQGRFGEADRLYRRAAGRSERAPRRSSGVARTTTPDATRCVTPRATVVSACLGTYPTRSLKCSRASPSPDILGEEVVDQRLVSQAAPLRLSPHGSEDLWFDPDRNQTSGLCTQRRSPYSSHHPELR